MRKIAAYGAGMLLAYVILLVNVELVMSNTQFYTSQFEKNKVYERFGRETADTETKALLAYIKAGKPLESSFLNEKEKTHMRDVRELYRNATIALYIAIILLVFLGVTERVKGRDIFMKAGLITMGITIAVGVMSIQFSESFTLFHVIAFDNQLWLLDPATDNLVNLFPESFFKSLIGLAMVGSFILGSLLLVGGIIQKNRCKDEVE